jgi:hypothetical protein
VYAFGSGGTNVTQPNQRFIFTSMVHDGEPPCNETIRRLGLDGGITTQSDQRLFLFISLIFPDYTGGIPLK